MKVLVAEDDRISRRRLQRDLEKWGHEVVTAEDGLQAWNKFQGEQFPLVISDWMMPKMDGLELVRRIRSSDAPGYVFVILLTAKSEKEDIVAGMEAGADDFLTKPFDRNELRVRLRAGVRIIELERSLAERNTLLQQANERMKRDLEAAAHLQHSLLPTELPNVDGVKFAWNFRPCDELAGDFLNVFQLDDRHVGLYVVDVSGHGVAASLLSVTISRVLTPEPSLSSLLVKPGRGPSERFVVDPAVVAQELNKRFPMEEFGDKYFTIAYGVLDTQTRQFRYASAGHPPIALFSAEQDPQLLRTEGMPIGWYEDADFEQHVVELAPGDRLCLYSDGVPEAMNASMEQFGDERFLRAFGASGPQPLEQRVGGVLQNIEQWCGVGGPKDDVSILAVEID
jgi:sigma-B regulation protein RsbU (phosphoserine phosphatase)